MIEVKWKKARKKPVIIEYREVIPNSIIFYGEALGEIPVERIQTIEGELTAFPGEDYIIRGIQGELYPIKKEIFEKTYERMEE